MKWKSFTKHAKEMTTVDSVEHAFAGLGAEVGEVLGVRQKSIYKDNPIDVDDLTSEIGDVFFYLANLMRLYDIEFKEVLKENKRKLKARRSKKREERARRRGVTHYYPPEPDPGFIDKAMTQEEIDEVVMDMFNRVDDDRAMFSEVREKALKQIWGFPSDENCEE